MRERILSSIIVFLWLLPLHFILITFFKFKLGEDYGFSLFSSELFNLWKEVYLLVIYALIFWYRRHFSSRFLLPVTLFSIVALVVSLLGGAPFKSMVLGFKYDIFPLFLLIFIPLLKRTDHEKTRLLKAFAGIVVMVITLSTIFFVVRELKPSGLRHLGFNPSSTLYKPGEKPPVYYNTSDEWMFKRESGIFSGPNSLGFFMISVFPLIVFLSLYVKRKKEKISRVYLILAIVLVIASYSRSSWVALFLQIIIVGWIGLPKLRKRVVVGAVGFISIVSYYVITKRLDPYWTALLLRGASTNGHAINLKEGIEDLIHRPQGHGLGYAGPAAVQTGWGVVPENRRVQIFLETGVVGGFLYLWIFYMLFRGIQWELPSKKVKRVEDMLPYAPFLVGTGLLGLMCAGMFLHSFDDSSITYMIFLLASVFLVNTPSKNV